MSSFKSPKEMQEYVRNMYARIFSTNPKEPMEELLAEYFHKDIVQYYNNEEVRYAELVQRLTALGDNIKSAEVTFKKFLVDGEQCAETHTLDVIGQDESAAKYKVMMIFRFHEKKIIEIDEMTCELG